MDQNLIDVWIAALESGDYKQTKNVLHDNEGFCCLGVAYDVAKVPYSWMDGSYVYDDKVGSHGAKSILGETMRERLGLNDIGSFDLAELQEREPELVSELENALGYPLVIHNVYNLVSLNDNGVPFSLIGKLIRAKPKWIRKFDDRVNGETLGALND